MTHKFVRTLSRTFLAFAGSSAIIAGSATAFAQPAQELEITAVPSTPIKGKFTLAAVGDLIYLRPMLATIERTAPEMLRILRSADVTYGNFETSVFDLASFKGHPQAESGGTWMLASPAVVTDVANMGFDIVSTANNHSTDWGHEGLTETLRLLDEAKLVRAGTGRNMTEARSPNYFDAAQGRIGLVASTSSFSKMSPASDPLGMVPGRPGANTIRTDRIANVSAEDLEVLRRITDTKAGAKVQIDATTFRAADTSSKTMTISFDANSRDEDANLNSIRQAKQNGNFVIYSFHNHQPGNAFPTPPAFAESFARRAIDAGADAFIGHGPHQLRGIEIYKNRPIFYSLGNFAMMNNSLDHIPADMYEKYGITPSTVTTPEFLQARGKASFADTRLYESVIAQSHYTDGNLTEIRLYPIDLGTDVTGAEKGVPKMASAQVAQRLLSRLRDLSAAYGTKISIEGGIGIIRIGK